MCNVRGSYLILIPSANSTEIHPFLLPLLNFMSFFYIPPSPIWAAHLLIDVGSPKEQGQPTSSNILKENRISHPQKPSVDMPIQVR